MTAAMDPVPSAAHLAPEDGPVTVPVSRALAVLLVVTAALGLAVSITLTLEKIRTLQNPNYTPSCNINPIISCGSVMRTAQAEAFGFLNSLIGIAGFAIVVTVGVGMLAGATYRRWFWLGVQGGTLFWIGFVHWLIDQTLYRIGMLCPYCMVVWAAMISLFWYTTLHNLTRGVIRLPARWKLGVREIAAYHRARTTGRGPPSGTWRSRS